MDKEELERELHYLFNPEYDEGGYPGELSHPRLEKVHKLDTSYLEEVARSFHWEGSTMHRHSLNSDAKEKTLNSLVRNVGVPERLFESGLRLYADSLLAYHESKITRGDIRFYPPIIMTFWSGFETYVRFASELLLITVKGIPPLVADYLREQQRLLDKKGEEKIIDRRRPVLERYAILLKFGYNYLVDRGNKYWQRLEKAKDLRDYYTHLDMHEPRAVSSHEVIDYMETVLLALIWPSCELKRTLMLGIYRLYWTWAELNRLKNEYVEQPLAMEWRLDQRPHPFIFHCNFENVDSFRFPNPDEHRDRFSKKGERK